MYPDYPTLSNTAYYVDKHPIYAVYFNEYSKENHSDMEIDIYNSMQKNAS